MVWKALIYTKVACFICSLHTEGMTRHCWIPCVKPSIRNSYIHEQQALQSQSLCTFIQHPLIASVIGYLFYYLYHLFHLLCAGTKRDTRRRVTRAKMGLTLLKVLTYPPPRAVLCQYHDMATNLHKGGYQYTGVCFAILNRESVYL